MKKLLLLMLLVSGTAFGQSRVWDDPILTHNSDMYTASGALRTDLNNRCLTRPSDNKWRNIIPLMAFRANSDQFYDSFFNVGDIVKYGPYYFSVTGVATGTLQNDGTSITQISVAETEGSLFSEIQNLNARQFLQKYICN